MGNIRFLENFFAGKQLTPAEIDVILPNFRPVTFKKNDFLLNAGVVASKHWLLESGFIRSFVIDPEGNDITTNFYSNGSIVIDWVSFMLRRPAREYIQATEDCTCWEIQHDAFQALFHGMQSFREQGRAMLVGSYFALKERSISMIADQAKDRYERLLKENPDILQHASLKHVATFLGITDTSLSRIRKEIVSK
jgi:CRP-like cAMP-binding protein